MNVIQRVLARRKSRRQDQAETERRIRRAVERARLDTYRPDREDRHTGWKAPR